MFSEFSFSGPEQENSGFRGQDSETEMSPGKCKTLKCFVRPGAAKGGELAIFSPSITFEENVGLEMPESLVRLSKGKLCSLNIPVKNKSSHNIVLGCGTILGKLQPVQSVVTLRPPNTYTATSEEPSVNNLKESSRPAAVNPRTGPCEQQEGWDPEVALDE
jgi:hypothetical protein